MKVYIVLQRTGEEHADCSIQPTPKVFRTSERAMRAMEPYPHDSYVIVPIRVDDPLPPC